MTDADRTLWSALESGCEFLRHERDGRGVHRLTLAAPQRFNVLSEGVLTALQAAVAQVAADEAARELVIAAEGKAFCAGHDLREMRAQPELAYYQRLFAQCSQFMLSLIHLPVPVVARVQGVAAAAGCQLVAQCDLAVAVQEARFAVNGIDLGLFCATPSVPLSRNLPAKPALEMLMTGRFLDADEALARGLLNRVVPAAELDAAVDDVLAALLARPRAALAMGKQLFYRQRELGIEAAYQLAGQTMACNLMLDEAQEGIQAFIEKREPAWRKAS